MQKLFMETLLQGYLQKNTSLMNQELLHASTATIIAVHAP